jgi:hypothetical protein
MGGTTMTDLEAENATLRRRLRWAREDNARMRALLDEALAQLREASDRAQAREAHKAMLEREPSARLH